MATQSLTQQSNKLPRALLVLQVLVAARFLLHAVYLPAYEGPDEPFHLARAAVLASGEEDGGREQDVPQGIVASVKAYPCGPDLSRALGCPPFGEDAAAFNLLRPPPPHPPATPVANYQAHQPPLSYLVMAGALRLGAILAGEPGRLAERQLLLMRLVAALLVVVTILWPIRKLSPTAPLPFQAGVLLVLLLPGAVESLVRVSNDVGVFVWSAFVMLAIRKQAPTFGLILLVACGPLIKLTALPVVAFVALWLFQRRGPWVAVAAAAASSTVFVVQLVRGWAWGGTLELNTGQPLDDPVATVVLGIAHSAYTFVKTTLWLGGWSVLRPPLWLLLTGAVIALAWLLSVRLRGTWTQALPHLLALGVAVLGLVAFAVGKRQLFGIWGAVGGWYTWGWLPWLAVAAEDLLAVLPGRLRILVPMSLGWCLAANVAWLVIATRHYGVL